MLGQAVRRTLAAEHDLIVPGRAELDITDTVALQRRLHASRPHWVLHLAALTDVDRCEREPEAAFRVNTAATETIVAGCRALDAGLLFVSTIAVFDGKKESAYVESDRPNPVNAYGCSKWRAEAAVASLPRHLIVRSSWLFGGGVVDKKFVGKILALAATRDVLHVVADKVGSPTSVDDLALGLQRLLQVGAIGLYHAVNAGQPASRFHFARAIVAAAALPVTVRPVTSSFFPQLAPRPDMEAARSEKLAASWLPPWPQALQTYVAECLQRPKLLGYDRDIY